MSEEQTVEQMLDEAAAQRAKDAGVEPAKADDEGKSATPADGQDTADLDDDQDEGDPTESEDEDAEGQEAQDADESEDEDEKPKPKRPSKAQKRIRRLVRERDEERARAEQREAELRVLLKRLESPAKPSDEGKPQEDAQPRQEDYDDYSKFLTDTAAWAGRQEAKKAMATEREAAKKAQAQGQHDRAQAERSHKAAELFATGEDAYEDFVEVASSNMPVTDVMSDAIMDMESGHEVLYHLGNNPEEAERISKLRPVSQVRELTKLEAKIAAPKPRPAPKKTTSATEPIKSVKAGGSPRKIDPDSMSTEEYMRHHADRRRRGEITV